MPKELIAVGPKQLVFREYEERPLKPNEVRVRSHLSAEKHGTIMPIFRGTSPFSQKEFDWKRGLLMSKKPGSVSTLFPRKVGNMTTGLITEVGETVRNLRVGDNVYGYLPIRETHVVSETQVNLVPPELSGYDMVCIDPAVVALMAVRYGNVNIGETVAVFGLGAIGLMAAQMCKISGAILVIGVEPIQKRSELAKKFGVDISYNPFECDAGLKLREATGDAGVDISIETSGSYRALHHAIRGTRYGGTIVPVSWYHGEGKGLNLGEEWHYNRHTLVSGARVESEPYRDHPRWNRQRVYDTVMQLMRQGRLRAEGLLDPIVKFDDAIEGYRLVDEEPQNTVKLGVMYE